ncbi:MAG: hypothetical protein IKI31_05875, partial [Treponema sp.]|nr:hypothetical protein [Treponema sp.]
MIMKKLFVFVIVVSLVACKSTKQEESKQKVLQEANQEKEKDSSLEKASEGIESLEKNKSIEKESEKIYEKESTSQKEDLQENQIVEKKSMPENVIFAQALQNFLSKGDIEGA